MQIKEKKVEKEKEKKEKKKNPKIKNGLKKNEKIEMKDRSQKNNGFVTRQEMILGLITFKHMLWAYLSFLS